jgi:hypothetical protein
MVCEIVWVSQTTDVFYSVGESIYSRDLRTVPDPSETRTRTRPGLDPKSNKSPGPGLGPGSKIYILSGPGPGPGLYIVSTDTRKASIYSFRTQW